jgi:hypothetical protein
VVCGNSLYQIEAWLSTQLSTQMECTRLNWGLRLNRMDCPIRPEMKPFAELAFSLRYIGQRPSDAGDHVWPVYGITYIEDLRPKGERL